MTSRLWVFTGGHHNSALVVAKKLLEAGDQIYWFGHRHAAAGDHNDSAEHIEVTAAGIPFFDLPAGKLSHKHDLLAIPRGIQIASDKLKQIHPTAVVSFGGYLGFATALAGLTLGLPIFLHEQTVVAGKANKFLSFVARRVYLTWESSLKYLPRKNNVKVVGLPLRPGLLNVPPVKLFKNGLPTLLILGGKQGSHILNTTIFNHLGSLLSRYNIIHQTGTSSVTGDYEAALSHQDALPLTLTSHYRPIGYVGESELATLLSACDLVIGRAGAHTTYELGILGQKSILVPFMHTHGHEQLHNARLLERGGLAMIIKESELTFPRLVEGIGHMLKVKNAKPLNLPKDATMVMIEDMQHAC